MALIIHDNGIIDFFSRDRSPVLTLKIDSYFVKVFKRKLKLAVNSYRRAINVTYLLYMAFLFILLLFF